MFTLYPFALYRIEKFTEYLNKQYQRGFAVTKILFGCIVFFNAVEPKKHTNVAILTRNYHRNMKREKWNDAKFIQSRHRFNTGNGFVCEIYALTVSTEYKIYINRVIEKDDIESLKGHRKAQIKRINICKGLWGVFDLTAIIMILFLIINGN